MNTANAIPTPGPSDADEHAEVLQLVYEVADIMRVDGGEEEPRASVLAQIVVSGLRRRVGGSSIYVLAPSRKKRNLAIRAKYDGSNMKEVCAEFEVSVPTVYRICGRRAKR